MLQPLVSVIVPCYNQAQYLDECLQSVLNQTYQKWECIIVNDGSPDNTEDIAKNWIEKDKRYRYLYKENGGISSARNTGIENASGEWILPLDADDYISEKYLELASKKFSHGYTVIYANARKFGMVNEEWVMPPFSLEALAVNNMVYCSGLFRKENWQNVGGYDVCMQFGFEDWEFWISLLKYGGEVKKIDEICFFYRIKSISRSTILLQGDRLHQMMQYMEKKHYAFFCKQLGTLHQNYFQKRALEQKLASKVYAFYDRAVTFVSKKILKR